MKHSKGNGINIVRLHEAKGLYAHTDSTTKPAIHRLTCATMDVHYDIEGASEWFMKT